LKGINNLFIYDLRFRDLRFELCNPIVL